MIMNKVVCRIEFKEILERTFLPEGISSEEIKEKILPLSRLIFENIPPGLFQKSNT